MQVETWNEKGYKVTIDLEEELSEYCDPRNNDNMGKMICFHKNYILGDKHEYSVPNSHKEFMETLEKDFGKGFIYLPLYLYDHSGISMSTARNYPFNCPWDSGQVGVIVMSLSDVAKEYPDGPFEEAIQQAYKCLEWEVKEYNRFLTGEVYGYVITHEDRLIETCWGFLGYDNVKEEVKGIMASLTDLTQYAFAL